MDEELIPTAKSYAKEHNRSLSGLSEEALRQLTQKPE